MGEKFAANLVTGSGSTTVPLAVSPGRSGFSPELSLSYDSGAGNGPFGFGWTLPVATITRKTEKGLPRYRDDTEEPDVMILSGAEDLVPLLGSRYEDIHTAPGYTIHRYRPRIEGLFARIERWTRSDGDIHWRSISRHNVLTIYGTDKDSRIMDPDDPRRVYSWLISETRDDKGNAVLYEYKQEDGAGVDVTQAHERNRVRTANLYLKRILYGNRVSLLDRAGHRPRFLTQNELQDAGWMFEVVFDFGEHDPDNPTPDDAGAWLCRHDPFSSYRAGFEIRTYRRCHRVLMFHRFDELGGEPCLVRATKFAYNDLDYSQSHSIEDELAHRGSTRVASFIRAVTQSGYIRQENGTYLKKSLPPLEFAYSEARIDEQIHELDEDSLENLPYGLDGTTYRWVDLDGEGVSGILTEQAGAWFYKPSLGGGRFGPLEKVAAQPSLAALSSGRQQLLDLAGDGQLDLVEFAGPVSGFFERTHDQDWKPFTPFTSLPNIPWDDPNLRFIDLNGDGHADVLITEHEVFTWYASLAEEGFSSAQQVRKPLDEEEGPRLVFADLTQSVYLADMSGDGLTDLVRITNGAVCYWPNLGYGRFGAKVQMDNAPWFDFPDQFDQRRIRMADIDGSGTIDIIYLGHDGVLLHFNESGNRWSEPRRLSQFPPIDDLTSVTAVDLLGNGTACLVWSSPLPNDALRPMRYIDLMGGQKPHLLTKVTNNLGAETKVWYVASTEFYLADKLEGKPWITRLPFPVHVVERVETWDHISRNRFVTRYKYHHGYFDGIEREFHGFGMVEQWDTEEFAALDDGGELSRGDNIDEASHVPPVHTKTWFHTGAYLDRERISRQLEGEYYREPGLDDLGDEAFPALLLPDTTLPTGLTLEEEREACRALKGMMLRQEVYSDDGTPVSSEEAIPRAETPYTVVEQDFTIRRLQPRADNRHAVFFTHPREAITYHYERSLFPILNDQIAAEAAAVANPNVEWLPDPRVHHALTLEVDTYGNALKEATIGYGRRYDAPDQSLLPQDRGNQRLTHITYTENRVTNPIDNVKEDPDDYRSPLPAETRAYELRTPEQEKCGKGRTNLYRFDDILEHIAQASDGEHDVAYEDIASREARDVAANDAHGERTHSRRLVEHVRTLYRPDILGVAQSDPLALLPLGMVGSLALAGESYQLAFTPGLLTRVFQREGQSLLPNPADVLAGQGADRGGYLNSQTLRNQNLFPPDPTHDFWTRSDADDHWWIPAGRVFLSPDSTDTAAQELVYARQHFFLPHRLRDPLGHETTLHYDDYDLLMLEITDPLGNSVTVGERIPRQSDDAENGYEIENKNDYRVLQPKLLTDSNGNRSEVAFDALGFVVATAVMGKREHDEDHLDDSLQGFEPDLTRQETSDFFGDPKGQAASFLGNATTRIIYDVESFVAAGSPTWAATLARETHLRDPVPDDGLKIQLGFSYSDGFGREVQEKIQAEPGPAPLRDAEGVLRCDHNLQHADSRWVGTGRTIYDNKGNPVKQYEPFFSPTHEYETERELVECGVTPILRYDPLGRLVATLHPNHTYEKVVFDAWHQEVWDVNDTVLQADPKDDPDVGDFFRRLPDEDYLPTWHESRKDGQEGAAEQDAAHGAAAHANTPGVAHLDTLGRTFLTVADNGLDAQGSERHYETRTELDIEGQPLAIIDALNRRVMAYALRTQPPGEPERITPGYDIAGIQLYQKSMDAGERWMLHDVAGKPIRAWDSRGHTLRTVYDALQRPTHLYVQKAASVEPNDLGHAERLAERTVYGEAHPAAAYLNLRGHPYQQYDGAGVVTNEKYDLKGNLLSTTRRLAKAYRGQVDWLAAVPLLGISPPEVLEFDAIASELAPLLEDDAFTMTTAYDALNRPTSLTTPDESEIEPIYNEANLLEWVNVRLRGAELATPFVTNFDYNAKGQRELIEYGNGVKTTYAYDPLTFRLVRLHTTRGETALQDLSYTYDPAGNITRIHDAAQPTTHRNCRRVEPEALYEYDALYRLVEAAGREHEGQIAHDRPERRPEHKPHYDFNDSTRLNLPHPNDLQGLRNYRQEYVYDEVGNILKMNHRAGASRNDGWTRHYAYAPDSNRLMSTSMPDDPDGGPYTGKYEYDAHGNMTKTPHLPQMAWDFKDQLHAAQQQVVNGDGHGEKTYYVYDAAGQRVRKVTERANGTRKAERLYLGGFEVYREYNGNATNLKLTRETLHIMDGERRLALVETKTHDGGTEVVSPTSLFRYQLGNHLASASLELDESGKVISYEEFHPYGSTSYQATSSHIEVSLKRYRYTGKERDEESGLYYHGARYYAPWLGRWTSPDPKGLADGTNLFAFVRSSPLIYADPNGARAVRMQEEPDDDAGLTDAQIQRAQELRSLFEEFARATNHSDLLKQLGAAADVVEDAKKQFDRFEKGRRARRGVQQGRSGAGLTLLIDAIIGGVQFSRDVSRGRHRRRREEAWVRLIEGTRELGVETFFELQEVIGPGGGLQTRARPNFIPVEDIEARVEARVQLKDFLEAELMRFPAGTLSPRREEFYGRKIESLQWQIERLEALQGLIGAGVPRGVSQDLRSHFEMQVELYDLGDVDALTHVGAVGIGFWYELLRLRPGVVSSTLQELRHEHEKRRSEQER